MEIGIGLDPTLGLSYEEQAQVSREAARASYQSIWTPENVAEDSFLTCALRWQATRDVVEGGLGTGIGVSPVGLRTPMGFAMSAGTLGRMTGGRFVLGIGTGQAYNPQYRRTWNMRGSSTLGLMRDYLTTIRALLAAHAEGKPSQFVDGVKIFHGEDWVLIYPSQDEAYFHLCVEAEDRRAAEDLSVHYADLFSSWSNRL